MVHRVGESRTLLGNLKGESYLAPSRKAVFAALREVSTGFRSACINSAVIRCLCGLATFKSGATELVTSKLQASLMGHHHLRMQVSNGIPRADFDTVIRLSATGAAAKAIYTI